MVSESKTFASFFHVCCFKVSSDFRKLHKATSSVNRMSFMWFFFLSFRVRRAWLDTSLFYLLSSSFKKPFALCSAVSSPVINAWPSSIRQTLLRVWPSFNATLGLEKVCECSSKPPTFLVAFVTNRNLVGCTRVLSPALLLPSYFLYSMTSLEISLSVVLM